MHAIAHTLVNSVSITAVFLITAWMLKTYLTHRENMKGLSMTKQGLVASDQRLERVEQAVEAIAIEVERISEGQRFVTKLLSDRASSLPDAKPLPARRVDTPH
ncbi:MAG TPA: hypothetical protein VGG78_09500 [Gemmatimonadaceae bacterium]|jgi:hypothetical protein